MRTTIMEIENKYLDNASKILLEGNSASAREYLSRNERKGDLLKKSLDYEYNIQFSRAVITQSRVLSEVDGVPSTFDFSGLVIDDGAYINDYSNRGNYKTHRKDFHLIWAEENSYYEDHVLKDLTGMDAISTVTGLQYAYAHPETYTVHVINSRNESVVDTLALTPNTKANMHADIAEGNTIITPDKFVEEGSFRGVLYVSLDDDWTGVYAIGEQVGNGGWTLEDFEWELYRNGELYIIPHKAIANERIYLHEDKLKGYFDCNISEESWTLTLTDPNWNNEYGVPCYKPDDFLEFGEEKVSYIVATHATKFHLEGVAWHSYWHKTSEIKEMLDDYIERNHLDVDEDYNYRFSQVLGTYMMGSNSDAVYYSPRITEYANGTIIKGEAIHVYGKIFEKLLENHNSVVAQIGYPMEMTDSVTSGFGHFSLFQKFLSGYVFYKDEWNVPYVPALFFRYYRNHDGGDGKFGVPEGDPYYKSGKLAQDFEGTRIEETDDTENKIVHSPVWYKKYDFSFPAYTFIDDLNFLIIELDPALKNRACFKAQIGLKDDYKIEDGVREFEAKDFEDLISDQNSELENSNGGKFYPVAAFNGDYISDETDAPMDMYMSLGYDYSGTRNWTAMAISQNNEVQFIKRAGNTESVASMKERLRAIGEKFLYNIIGGGPLIIEGGDFTENTCNDLLGEDWEVDLMCTSLKDQRTIAGITEDGKYMIVLVATDGPWELLELMINVFSNNYGRIKEANMFDGGGSPSMMFEGEIKREADPITSALLIYSGEACE